MINMMMMMPVSAEPWFTRESTRLDVFPSSIDRFSTNSRVHWTCKHKRKGWTRFISPLCVNIGRIVFPARVTGGQFWNATWQGVRLSRGTQGMQQCSAPRSSGSCAPSSAPSSIVSSLLASNLLNLLHSFLSLSLFATICWMRPCSSLGVCPKTIDIMTPTIDNASL